VITQYTTNNLLCALNEYALKIRYFIETSKGWKRSGFSFLFGICAAFSLPPANILPLLIPAFTGLIWLIASSSSVRQTISAGWYFGFGYFIFSCYWVGSALLLDTNKFAWLAIPAVLALCAGLAIFPALVALFVFLSGRTGLSRIILFSVSWAFTEWLRGEILTGFPMNPIGSAWSVTDGMLQSVALFGTYGLSFFTVLGASVAALVGKKKRSHEKVKCLGPIIIIFLILLIAISGNARLWLHGVPSSTNIQVMIVQANIEQELKWDPLTRKKALEKHVSMTIEARPPESTYIIWPETAVPYDISNNNDLAEWLATVIPHNGILITGALRKATTQTNGQKEKIWNSLYALDSDSKIVASYDKHHLVPFGEYMPIRSVMSFAKLTYGDIDFSSGTGPKTLYVPNLPPFSPLICYEAIFPGEVTEINDRPAWLLNITNDGWFGRTAGPYQHLQAARFRAVEEGLPIIRAANTGISAAFDPFGRRIAYLPLGHAGILNIVLPKETAPTPYAILGNWFLVIISLISLAVIALRTILKLD